METEIESLADFRAHQLRDTFPDFMIDYEVFDEKWVHIRLWSHGHHIASEYIETSESFDREGAISNYLAEAKEGCKVNVIVPEEVVKEVIPRIAEVRDERINLLSYDKTRTFVEHVLMAD